MDAKKQAIRIKVKLLEAGITQTKIAEDLDFTPAFVSMVISGKRKSKKVKNWLEKNLEVAA